MAEVALPLAFAEQPRPPKRPSRYEESVKRAAAELLLPDIIKWLGKDYREAERDDLIADLIEIADKLDGYEAARELERLHWFCDADLVEILDGSYMWRAEEKAIEAWVDANVIAPKLAIGDHVATRHGEGPIISIDRKRAAYVVQTDAFLAEHPDQIGKGGGFIVSFEDVNPAKPNSEPELRQKENDPIPVYRPTVKP
jgi:hypothetical protein